MVIRKKSYLKKSTQKIKQVGLVLGGTLLITGFIACGGQNSSEEVLDPTQGVITEVKEMEKDKFRITDEKVVSKKEDSRVIAEYLDGTRDTFTLDEVKVVEQQNSSYRHRSMNGILIGGLMGYMMGKSMSTPISSGAYASNAAYQKSSQANNSLRSTATRRTVSRPRSGFGSSKSSRSYGG